MGDIALSWNDATMHADIDIGASDLVTDDGLQTAAYISLFSDRRAELGEELPIGETSRRGWWGDTDAEVPGDMIGSRLWLLSREKNTPEVITRANEYARECLQWMIDDRVAKRIDIDVTAVPFGQQFGLVIQGKIYRPSGDPVQFKFDYAWQAQAAKT
ncbi:phage GP46 family protein [Bradyrhizobium sp.]|uniref:phage GP46 family protein n=1 Tax=Bradyrhizobium sp. TaxID=376 RepID=UPI0039E5CA5F